MSRTDGFPSGNQHLKGLIYKNLQNAAERGMAPRQQLTVTRTWFQHHDTSS